jgi:uncharacterized protein YgbK (DUF1537 family)
VVRKTEGDIVLGAVADDYTGATDLANSFARAGLRTIQTIGVPDTALPLAECDALVVALKSRSIPADEAVALSRRAHDWLREQGCAHVLFKICSTFDSTDAGNIGPVMDALTKPDDGPVMVCPAFPGAGRSVYQGHLFVGDRLLSESPLRHHPLNPMHDPDLVRVLGRQSRQRIGLLPFGVVETGASAAAERLAGLAKEGFGAVIADALTDKHLDILGQCASRQSFSVGGSGLGAGIARAMVRAGTIEPQDGEALTPLGGKGAVLCGSCSAATLAQIDAAQDAGMPVMRLDAMRIPEEADQLRAEVRAWYQGLEDNPAFLIAASADPQQVAQVQERFGREAAGLAIERLIACIAQDLFADGIRRFIVAGGETSGAVTDALGVEALLIGPEIAPGVPATHGLGVSGGRVGLVLKSGNFGTREFFSQALQALG